MHNVFRIPEILASVLSYIPTKHLPRAACVSRAFFLPAAALMWRSIDWETFLRVVKPLFNTKGLLVHRKYTGETGERALQYASFVTTFHMNGAPTDLKASQTSLLNRSIIQLGSQNSPLPLFSGLRTLSYWASKPSELHSVRYMLSPSLRELILNTPSAERNEAKWASSWSMLISAVPTWSPDLRECRLEIRVPLKGKLLKSLINALNALPKIECFECDKVSLIPKLLNSLASLPSLHTLNIVSIDYEDRMPMKALTGTRNPFPALRSLSLFAVPLPEVVQLLKLLPPRLEAIALQCFMDYEVIGKSGAMSYFASVVRSRCINLRRLEIHLSEFVETLGSDDKPGISWNEFSPLLHCKNMERFEYRHETSLSLDLRDEHVLAMAKAWPRLTFFDITWMGDLFECRRPTIAVLGALARRCPRLRHIGLTNFTTHAIPRPPSDISLPANQPLELALGICAIENPSRIASFLAACWPRVTICLTRVRLPEDETPMQQQEEEEFEAWEVVVRMMKIVRCEQVAQLGGDSASVFGPDRLNGFFDHFTRLADQDVDL